MSHLILIRFVVEARRDVSQAIVGERKSWAEIAAAIELELRPKIIWH